MKNMVKLFWSIAIVAVIGLGITGCKDDTDDPSTDGRLTITGLESYIGMEIVANAPFFDNGAHLNATLNKDPNATSSYWAINGNSITFDIWIVYAGTGGGLYKNYTGNDQNVVFNCSIRSSSDGINFTLHLGTATANFSNGKATAAFFAN